MNLYILILILSQMMLLMNLLDILIQHQTVKYILVSTVWNLI